MKKMFEVLTVPPVAGLVQGLTHTSAKQNTPRCMQLQTQSKGMHNLQAYLHSGEYKLPPTLPGIEQIGRYRGSQINTGKSEVLKQQEDWTEESIEKWGKLDGIRLKEY